SDAPGARSAIVGPTLRGCEHSASRGTRSSRVGDAPREFAFAARSKAQGLRRTHRGTGIATGGKGHRESGVAQGHDRGDTQKTRGGPFGSDAQLGWLRRAQALEPV